VSHEGSQLPAHAQSNIFLGKAEMTRKLQKGDRIMTDRNKDRKGKKHSSVTFQNIKNMSRTKATSIKEVVI
jgi:hypothetical protein